MYDAKKKNGNLVDPRIIAICLLAYAGFFRSAELLAIKRCDLVFAESYMSDFVEKSKTEAGHRY